MTFCGKNCDECAYKKENTCPGCMEGPGRRYSDDCEIASCAREKGHDMCENCTFKNRCGKLLKKDGMAEERIRRRDREVQKKEMMIKKAEFLGPWMKRLFWLVIPMAVSVVLTMDTVKNISYTAYEVGSLLNIITFLVYGIFLLKMSREEEYYKKAGIFRIITAAASILSYFMSLNGLIIITALVTFVITILGEYNEYYGHSAVLKGIDDELSENWKKLWKWYIGMFIAVAASVLLIFILSMLGAFIILASIIGIIVVSIVKIVYVYKSADALKRFAGTQQKNH